MPRLIDTLSGRPQTPPAIWMMRQAGRYLPEYRATRRKAGSFLDLCYNPELAAEVTLQPIKRFGFDAAILFSDILVVPHALGRDLRFDEGHGPAMTPLRSEDIAGLASEDFHERLEPVYETVRLVRSALPNETALIGFCGAPWTVATYMIAGHGTPDQAPTRLFSYQEEEAFEKLISILAECSAAYLLGQVRAGADVLQIFDSWCGVLDDEGFARWCVQPISEIVRLVREEAPDVPIIAFPKGAGARYADFREKTGVTALGLDWSIPLRDARKLQEKGAVQGNLDPLRLLAGGKALAEGVDAILEALAEGPFVFNLGHGILPQTPIAHVEEMLLRVRGGVS